MGSFQKCIRGARGMVSCVAATACLSLIADGALAQIEEIVVTARKREESLQETPLSITAFGAQLIEQGGIRHMQDVAKLTPSLVFETSFVPQDTRPVIRGLSATRGRQPIGVLLDGIDISSESLLTGGGGIGVNLRLVDAERIEVVKGPQSALYGRVAFGGAINYISKNPADELESRIFTDIGSNGQLEVTGSISGPLVEDKVGLRFNATHAQHDGFYNNAITGGKIGDFESSGAALSARIQATDKFEINTRLAYSKDESGPAPQYFLGFANGGTQQTPLPAGAQPLIDVGVLPATTLLAPRGQFQPVTTELFTLSKDPRTGAEYPGADFDSLNFSLRTEYDFGKVKFNSWSGYQVVNAFYRVDTDFYAVPDAPVVFPLPGGVAEPLPNTFESSADIETQTANQEFRFSDMESDGFRWAVGGLYWYENVNHDDRNLITVVVAPPGAGSAALNTRLAGVDPSRVTGRQTNHWSVYGMVEFDFSDRLTLSLEGRYSDETFDYVWPSGGAAVSVFGGPAPPGAYAQFIASDGESFFAPKATLEFKAADELMYYGTISKGVKPGGYSTVAAPFLENAKYGTENVWNYEAGVKSSWNDGRLIANGSVFFMDYTDKQFQTQIPCTAPVNCPANGLTGKTVNAADSEVLGFELELLAAPTDSITLSLGYTHLDSKYTNFILFSNTPLSIALAGNCTPTVLNGTPGCDLNFNGQKLERAPENALNVSAGYRAPISGDREFFGVIEAQYQSERGNDTSEYNFYGDYWNVDARLGVETDVWSAFIYGTNIFGDDTVRGGTGFGDFTAFGNIGFALNAPPDTQVGVRFSYAWE